MKSKSSEKKRSTLRGPLLFLKARNRDTTRAFCLVLDYVAPTFLVLLFSNVAIAMRHFDSQIVPSQLLISLFLSSIFNLATELHSPANTLKSGTAFLTSCISIAAPQYSHIVSNSLDTFIKIGCIVGFSSLAFILFRPIWMNIYFRASQIHVLMMGTSPISRACCSEAQLTPSLRNKPYYIFHSPFAALDENNDQELKQRINEAKRFTESETIDFIVFSPEEITSQSDNFDSLITAASNFGCKVCSDIDLYRFITKSMPIEFYSSLSVPYRHLLLKPSTSIFQGALQRALDNCIALLGVIIMISFIPVVMILNFCSGDFGPLFYSQVRVGKGGSFYRILKFRSMRLNAEEHGVQWADKNDDRVTVAGKFLRLTRIDELPQFLNVLKGEMSVVGPRPERPELIEIIKEKLPFYELRHLVKPGITGWAQINYRYGNSVDDALIKLRYDLEYIRSHSIGLNFLIILRTPIVMIRKIGY